MKLQEFKKIHPIGFWAVVIIAGSVIITVSFFIYVAYLMPLPPVFRDFSNQPTTKIFDRNGILLYEVLQPESGKKSLISLKDIPKTFVNATLAAEDINFYSHPGIDFNAILRALFFNVREQRIVSGGSTITQQLIRNLLGSKINRNLSDKILEAMYAVRISNVYSKDQILELYLNKIYYGNMAYGSQSAALDYFGKNIYDLDLAEISLLAGLPQSPSSYNPFVYFDKAKKRQKYVLDQMVKYHFITDDQAAVALAEPLTFRRNKYKIKAPHFVHYVINRLEEKYGEDAVNLGGLSVITTLDYNLQQQAEGIITRRVEALKNNNVTNGALLSIDVKTGQILAWVGSKDYFDAEIAGQVDIINALRQPGSSIKPLTYLAAFEKGYTPATVLYDIPSQFNTASGPYAPKNYDLKYHGPVRVRTALASSFNIPAVKTLEYVGVGNFMAFLNKFGIDSLDSSPDFYGLALTLGGGEVSVFDMANAFNTIANYGIKRDSSVILEVKSLVDGLDGATRGVDVGGREDVSEGGDSGQNDANPGESEAAKVAAAPALPEKSVPLFEWSLPAGNNVLGPFGRQHAYQIIDILKDPLARIPGFGEDSALEIGREAAVKTGTTRNFKDNWTIGFTPQLLTAVWVGNADASSMENVSGVDGAAPIWADFMKGALQSRPMENFVKPSGLNEIEICAISGKLPTGLCNERVYELFIKGNEPKEYDNYYRKFWIDSGNGKIITDECKKYHPELKASQKTLIAYPQELQKWAAQNGLGLAEFKDCITPGDYPDAYTNGKPEGNTNAVFIDNPINNDEYQIDYSLPMEAQKIPFRVSVPLETIKVNYYIDNVNVGNKNEAPFTYLWLASKGSHKLKAEAVLAGGKVVGSEEVKFIVR